MLGNLHTRQCLPGFDTRIFSNAKISMSTVRNCFESMVVAPYHERINFSLPTMFSKTKHAKLSAFTIVKDDDYTAELPFLLDFSGVPHCDWDWIGLCRR